MFRHITEGTYSIKKKDKSFLNPEPVLFTDGYGHKLLAFSHFRYDKFAPCIYIHDLKENKTIAKAHGGEVFLDFCPLPD